MSHVSAQAEPKVAAALTTPAAIGWHARQHFRALCPQVFHIRHIHAGQAATEALRFPLLFQWGYPGSRGQEQAFAPVFHILESCIPGCTPSGRPLAETSGNLRALRSNRRPAGALCDPSSVTTLRPPHLPAGTPAPTLFSARPAAISLAISLAIPLAFPPSPAPHQ